MLTTNPVQGASSMPDKPGLSNLEFEKKFIINVMKKNHTMLNVAVAQHRHTVNSLFELGEAIEDLLVNMLELGNYEGKCYICGLNSVNLLMHLQASHSLGGF